MTEVINLEGVRAASRAAKPAKPPAGPPSGPPGDTPAHEQGMPPEICPVTALGHLDGKFYFLDIHGQVRALTARQLMQNGDLLSLFTGDPAWLEGRFPRMLLTQKLVDGKPAQEWVQGGINVAQAGASLMKACGDAGLYGEHVRLRHPGVWPGPDGAPVVHVGDAVIIDGLLHPAGIRTGNFVWAAAARIKRPAAACGPEAGQWFQSTVAELWRFREPGAELLVLGLLGIGYLGAAASWRSNGFLLGPVGSGKSLLLDMIRAAAPLHSYTNDATKAGIEQAAAGRAMAIYIDEASDRVDQTGAQNLMDMVLAATGGDGVKGKRGTADGAGRIVEMVGAVLMAATSPPAMKPQHLARFTLIELLKPGSGEDHRLAMQAATARAAELGPALWGRMLLGHGNWVAALAEMRAALGRVGCAAREMDQLGALLASWWVLTHDGVPDARQALDGVHGAVAFVRPSGEVAADDTPRLCVQHLMSSRIQRTHTTDMVPVGELLEKVFRPVGFEPDQADAAHHLARHGIRAVAANDPGTNRGGSGTWRPSPRLGDGDGVWLSATSVPLNGLFRGSAFESPRWLFALLGLDSAKKSSKNVRIGGHSARAVWISYDDLAGDDG